MIIKDKNVHFKDVHVKLNDVEEFYVTYSTLQAECLLPPDS